MANRRYFSTEHGVAGRAALGAFLRAAHEMREHGTFGYNDDAIPSNEVNALFAQVMRAFPRCA